MATPEPTNHDPLCPHWEFHHPGGWTVMGCQCDLIARVEKREQERHGDNCGGMWDEWLTDLQAKVQTLRTRGVETPEYVLVRRDDVLDLLKGDDGND